ncbi:MAG: PaaX family transcriptional regulator C-terminal domain-containing protein [Nocardioides alkalitolerans]
MIDDEQGGTVSPGADAPPRSLIVTIYGLYARELGGWMSVSDLILLMAELGVDAQAVRSSVSRLKRRGILVSERRGSAAGYALSPYARDVLGAGDRRIFARPANDDVDWVVAVFSVPESERQKRHALRARLTWLGFGTVTAGVWIAPGHLVDDTREVLAAEGLDTYVDLFRADHLGFGATGDKVARWWDLGALDGLYRDFLAAQAPVLERWQAAGEPSGADGTAFADYVRALTAWRRFPYLDPGLPADLLPEGWSGTRAADTFFELRRLLAGPAHDFAVDRTAVDRTAVDRTAVDRTSRA